MQNFNFPCIVDTHFHLYRIASKEKYTYSIQIRFIQIWMQIMLSSLLTTLAFSPLPPFIFALIIGIPSAILYATQLVLIFFGQKNIAFQSSFFKIFAVRALWVYLN